MIDPFKEMEEFNKRLDKFLSSINFEISPRTNIYEKDGELVVEMEMPGIRKEEIKLAVTSDSIDVSAEHREKKEEENKRFWRKEISERSYSQHLDLPVKIDPDSVVAKYENGVLKITGKKVKGGKKEVKIQ